MGYNGNPDSKKLEHESKMLLLKTHSHTSERQSSEAGKARQQRERKEGLA